MNSSQTAAPGLLPERVHFVHARDGHRLALTEVSDGRAAARDGRRMVLGLARRPGPGGAAPCFLLIHGFSQDRTAFLHGPLPAALLERGARVFVGELRGHGLSDEGRPRSWSLRTHLEEDLPALIARALELADAAEVHLFGHSMGGMLGYALAGRGAPLASLTTFAAPVTLGLGRPLVRLAAAAIGPAFASGRHPQFPIDRLLRGLAPVLTAPDSRFVRRTLQRFLGLTNPRAADAEVLRRLLEGAVPEASAVFTELARSAVRGRTVISGVHLESAARRFPRPLAALVGAGDIFAPRASVAALERLGAAGPRLILELPEARHVDLLIGAAVLDTVDTLWKFLISA